MILITMTRQGHGAVIAFLRLLAGKPGGASARDMAEALKTCPHGVLIVRVPTGIGHSERAIPLDSLSVDDVARYLAELPEGARWSAEWSYSRPGCGGSNPPGGTRNTERTKERNQRFFRPFALSCFRELCAWALLAALAIWKPWLGVAMLASYAVCELVVSRKR